MFVLFIIIKSLLTTTNNIYQYHCHLCSIHSYVQDIVLNLNGRSCKRRKRRKRNKIHNKQQINEIQDESEESNMRERKRQGDTVYET